MNTLVSAPHINYTRPMSLSSSTVTQPTPTAAPSSSPAPPPKPRLRPLSLLLDSPRSPPLRHSYASGSASTSASPAPSPGASGSGRRRAGVKRMSSISYSYSPQRPVTASSDGTLGSPAPISSQLPTIHSNEVKENKTPNATANPAALTLAEKHADLLHFIAQKESRTMELRRQLGEAEKELAGLKKKWEGIVSRSQAGLPSPAGGSAGAALPLPAAGKGKSVGEVLRSGTKMINDLVFETPSPSATSPPASAPASSTSGLGLFTPSSTPLPKSVKHVQMVPMSKKTGPAAARPESMSSISSLTGSATSMSTSTEESSFPRSPSPLSTLSSNTISTNATTTAPSPAAPSKAPFNPTDNPAAGPTLQALTTTLNKTLDSIRASETYTTSSKRASQLFSTGLGQLSGFGLGLASQFTSPTSPGPVSPGTAGLDGDAGAGGAKQAVTDYGYGRLTSPKPRPGGGGAKRFSGSGPTSPLTSGMPSTLDALTLGITTTASVKPTLSPIPSPRSGSSLSLSGSFSLMDDPLSESPLGLGAGQEVLIPTPSPAASSASLYAPPKSAASIVPTPRSAGGHRLGLPGVRDGAGEGEGDVDALEEEDAWGW